jgi:hypothetical protein|tara:strand:+ start:3355 stop:3942 length:588 start_codon:yes stop_codon:yes gene_type:complete
MMSLILQTAYAEEFNYDYIDVSIIKYDWKSTNYNFKSDGVGVYVSKDLPLPFTDLKTHIIGGYLGLETAGGVSHDYASIGFGLSRPINESADIVLDYLYYRYDDSTTEVRDINSIKADIRYQYSDDVEMNVGYIHKNWYNGCCITSPSFLFKGFHAGALYSVNDDISLKFDMYNEKDSVLSIDSAGKEFGIRYNY